MLKLIKVARYIPQSTVKCRNFMLTTSNLQNASSAPEPTVIVEKDNNITLIGINRESARNAIDTPTADQLSGALQAFETDDTSPVAVLYGVGGSFCSGYDLKELEKQAKQGSYDFLLKHEGSVGPTRRHLRKPVVCSISGFCVANGLELALLCDLRVMEDTAILGFFNRRLGVPLSDGGTVRLAAAVGYSQALDLLHTGRKIGGKEALEIGLINRLVATGSSLGQAVNLAFSIAKFPLAAIQHDRNSVYSSVYERTGFRASIQNEVMYTSNDMIKELKEGVTRFIKSELKGSRTNSFNVKEKPLPDWEKKEIEIEEKNAGVKAGGQKNE